MCKVIHWSFEYWSSFWFHCKKFPSVKKFTLALLLILLTYMRYGYIPCHYMSAAMRATIDKKENLIKSQAGWQADPSLFQPDMWENCVFATIFLPPWSLDIVAAWEIIQALVWTSPFCSAIAKSLWIYVDKNKERILSLTIILIGSGGESMMS